MPLYNFAMKIVVKLYQGYILVYKNRSETARYVLVCENCSETVPGTFSLQKS